MTSNVYEKYLIKLLIDNKLVEFHRIAETEKIIRNCHLMFDNGSKNCSKGYL
jgi:hypothetical protein